MLAVLTFVLVASSAFALETKISGFYQFMAASNNFEATNNYVGSFKDNADNQQVIDQRLRLKLDGKVNEHLSFVYQAEIDFQWGDDSYTTRRNDGGAIGADTVNLETKHAYIDVKFDGDATARLGLQSYYDRQDQVFFAADMAGAKVDFSLGTIGLTAAMFNLIEGEFESSDNVYLWALQASLPAQGNFTTGVDYFYFQNRGKAGYANFFGTADMTAVNFDGPGWSGDREDMDLHFLGLQGDFKVSDNASLNGWVMLSAGTVDGIPTAVDSTDVQGYAASVRGTFKLAGLNTAARLLYFSGDEDLTDEDADFIVNPLATESYAFGDDGFIIFLQDVNWANVGQYGFAMMDAAYAGYGLLGANVTVATTFADNKADFKSGIGYFASTEDTLAAGDPRTSRGGTSLGTEIFARAGYTFANNLYVSLNGAYAWLGNFYDNSGGGTAINTPASSVENPYEIYLLAQLNF
jgi:hypothetical protein